MERVGEVGGVLFVNDSKATNPASTAPALAAFPPEPSKRVHWIVGGLPKGDDLDECAPHFGNVAAAYTIGEAGPRFAEILEPLHAGRAQRDAVRGDPPGASPRREPGDVVLLSPACASFDQFRDYEARGDSFRQIVAELTGAADARAGRVHREVRRMTAARPYIPRPGERGAPAQQFPRSRTRRAAGLVARDRPRAAARWCWLLMAIGAVAVAAASPASARRLSTAAASSSATCTSSGCTCAGSSSALVAMLGASLLPAELARRGGDRARRGDDRRAAAGAADRQRSERRAALAQPRHLASSRREFLKPAFAIGAGLDPVVAACAIPTCR